MYKAVVGSLPADAAVLTPQDSLVLRPDQDSTVIRGIDLNRVDRHVA